jgi:hypothetical protein
MNWIMGQLLNNELETTLKETLVAKYGALLQHSPRGSKENHKKKLVWKAGLRSEIWNNDLPNTSTKQKR